MGCLPFRISLRFAIHFVKTEAMMILIVDHRSRFPEALLRLHFTQFIQRERDFSGRFVESCQLGYANVRTANSAIRSLRLIEAHLRSYTIAFPPVLVPLAFGILPDFAREVVPGGRFRLKLVSTAAPGLVGCSGVAGPSNHERRGRTYALRTGGTNSRL